VRRSAQRRDGQRDLRWAYPGYPDAGDAEYALAITAEELAGAGPQPVLRVLARNRHGVATEIDRRRLTIAP
jgi:hypothetical protein